MRCCVLDVNLVVFYQFLSYGWNIRVSIFKASILYVWPARLSLMLEFRSLNVTNWSSRLQRWKLIQPIGKAINWKAITMSASTKHTHYDSHRITLKSCLFSNTVSTDSISDDEYLCDWQSFKNVECIYLWQLSSVAIIKAEVCWVNGGRCTANLLLFSFVK